MNFINNDLNKKYESFNSVIRILILIGPFFAFIHYGLLMSATAWMFGFFVWRTNYQNKSRREYWEDHIIVPKTPPKGLLESMAMRYNHSFHMECKLTDEEILKEREEGNFFAHQYLTRREKDAILETMRQLHEEVVGEGFYNYKK